MTEEYERLKRNVLLFLKGYVNSEQIFSEPKIYGNRITAEFISKVSYGTSIFIDIIVGECVSSITLETYLDLNNNYENKNLQFHVYNILNKDMQPTNIITTFSNMYPKFEQIIKNSKEILEE
jgi:hypothetical protein